jgi:hypothetical protein
VEIRQVGKFLGILKRVKIGELVQRTENLGNCWGKMKNWEKKLGKAGKSVKKIFKKLVAAVYVFVQ